MRHSLRFSLLLIVLTACGAVPPAVQNKVEARPALGTPGTPAVALSFSAVVQLPGRDPTVFEVRGGRSLPVYFDAHARDAAGGDVPDDAWASPAICPNPVVGVEEIGDVQIGGGQIGVGEQRPHRYRVQVLAPGTHAVKFAPAGDCAAPGPTLSVTGVAPERRVSVAAGHDHSLALRADGTVWAWGANALGQLGDGGNAARPLPAAIKGVTDALAISAGGEYSLALGADGTVLGWGYNGYARQLDPAYQGVTRPATVEGLSDVVAVSVGGYHSLALRADGTVLAWGANTYGQLGSGAAPSTDAPVPALVTGLTDVVAVAAGGLHSLALRADGSVWAWGNNYDGQLGDGTREERDRPGPVKGLKGAVAISAGLYHSLALRADGGVVGWGANLSGQLSADAPDTGVSVPTGVKGLAQAVAISAGSLHSLALLRGGAVWAWGKGDAGQLGRGGDNSSAPGAVAGLSATALVAGGNHNLALGADGAVWAWGAGDAGQLGDGTTQDSATPVQVQLKP